MIRIASFLAFYFHFVMSSRFSYLIDIRELPVEKVCFENGSVAFWIRPRKRDALSHKDLHRNVLIKTDSKLKPFQPNSETLEICYKLANWYGIRLLIGFVRGVCFLYKVKRHCITLYKAKEIVDTFSLLVRNIFLHFFCSNSVFQATPYSVRQRKYPSARTKHAMLIRHARRYQRESNPTEAIYEVIGVKDVAQLISTFLSTVATPEQFWDFMLPFAEQYHQPDRYGYSSEDCDSDQVISDKD